MPLVLGMVLLALVGVLGLVLTIRQTIDYRKFGDVRFAYTGSRPELGGMLRGELQLPKNTSEARTVRAQIECHKVEFYTYKGRTRRRFNRIWYRETTFPIQHRSLRPSVTIEFPIPDRSGTESGHNYEWELEVHVEVTGLDLRRTYPIHVMKAQLLPAVTQPTPIPASTVRQVHEGAAAVSLPARPKPLGAVPKPIPISPGPELGERTGDYSPAALIFANLIPIGGVVFLDWQAGDIVMLYWIETMIIGFMNILRILTAYPTALVKPKEVGTGIKPGELVLTKLFGAAFFIIHYGGIAYFAGLFIPDFFPLSGVQSVGFSLEEVIWRMLTTPWSLAVIVSLLVSHFLSFLWNYLGKGEYKRVDLGLLMWRPYARISVVALFTVSCGFLLNTWSNHLYPLIVFIVIKIVIDREVHLRERKFFRERGNKG